MISSDLVDKPAIRGHYDLATPFYRLLWGPHIHHGLWSAEDAARRVPLVGPRACGPANACSTSAAAWAGRRSCWRGNRDAW